MLSCAAGFFFSVCLLLATSAPTVGGTRLRTSVPPSSHGGDSSLSSSHNSSSSLLELRAFQRRSSSTSLNEECDAGLVFDAGLPRTGTTSISSFCEGLGFGSIHILEVPAEKVKSCFFGGDCSFFNTRGSGEEISTDRSSSSSTSSGQSSTSSSSNISSVVGKMENNNEVEKHLVDAFQGATKEEQEVSGGANQLLGSYFEDIKVKEKASNLAETDGNPYLRIMNADGKEDNQDQFSRFSLLQSSTRTGKSSALTSRQSSSSFLKRGLEYSSAASPALRASDRQVFEDLPTFGLTCSLVEKYPDARFVLTRRDFEPYFKSVRLMLCKWSAVVCTHPNSDLYQVSSFFYGEAFEKYCEEAKLPEGKDQLCGLDGTGAAEKQAWDSAGLTEAWREIQTQHDQQVQNCVPQSRLLEVQLTDSDEVKAQSLHSFLGCKGQVPAFPHENQSLNVALVQ